MATPAEAAAVPAAAEVAVVDAAEASPLVGAGYRRELHDWIFNGPVDCVEITAEHFFFGRADGPLEQLARTKPVIVHGLSLSLGTPGLLIEDHVREFERVVRLARPMWISEHVAMTRTESIQLGHLTPVVYSERSLSVMSDHARELMDRCGLPLILENITSHIRVDHPMAETDFLNELCRRSGAGLLLDVTNLTVNALNENFDPLKWLREIDPQFVRQIHAVGFSSHDGVAYDCHSRDLNPRGLLNEVIESALALFRPLAITLERDENFPGDGSLDHDIGLLRERIRNRAQRFAVAHAGAI